MRTHRSPARQHACNCLTANIALSSQAQPRNHGHAHTHRRASESSTRHCDLRTKCCLHRDQRSGRGLRRPRGLVAKHATAIAIVITMRRETYDDSTLESVLLAAHAPLHRVTYRRFELVLAMQRPTSRSAIGAETSYHKKCTYDVAVDVRNRATVTTKRSA
jgi:hypothetical protein